MICLKMVLWICGVLGHVYALSHSSNVKVERSRGGECVESKRERRCVDDRTHQKCTTEISKKNEKIRNPPDIIRNLYSMGVTYRRGNLRCQAYMFLYLPITSACWVLGTQCKSTCAWNSSNVMLVLFTISTSPKSTYGCVVAKAMRSRFFVFSPLILHVFVQLRMRLSMKLSILLRLWRFRDARMDPSRQASTERRDTSQS